MSSNISSNALTKEQLFACLESDEIVISPDTINKAKINDGEALLQIGYAYYSIKQDHSKAMVWYQLAVNQNSADAYNMIGMLYARGLGVSQDFITAMDYFLKAARSNHKNAMSSIGNLFLHGIGVSADKYKALEWFTGSKKKPEEVKKLNQQGLHLTEEDKKKTIYQLIHETEDIIREARMKRESQLKEEVDQVKSSESRLKEENSELKTSESTLKEEINELKLRESKSSEEIQELKKTKSTNEQEIQRLQNELQKQVSLFEQEKQKCEFSAQFIGSLEHRLTDKTETINALKRENDVYQTLVQSKNNEIKAVKIEKENLELKRKLEKYERRSRPLIDNSNSTNDNNNATNNTTELDNQVPLSDTTNGSVDTARVKTETESENDSSPTCQIGNKKRKVTPNDS